MQREKEERLEMKEGGRVTTLRRRTATPAAAAEAGERIPASPPKTAKNLRKNVTESGLKLGKCLTKTGQKLDQKLGNS